MERGEPARTVAANVRAVREHRKLHQQQLAERLAALGRPMAQTGLSRLEDGKRRIDVDDLVALAVALNVSPARLLLPDTEDLQDLVRPVPNVEVQVWRLWEWLSGQRPLPVADSATAREEREHLRDFRDAWPGWLRDVVDHPLYQGLSERLLHAGRQIARLVSPGRPNVELIAKGEVASMLQQLRRMQEPPDQGSDRG